MYDIRHRLIWAISGFVSAVSLLVLMTLAGYGLFKALLLSLLILALVALVLWILWVSEPESLVDILAPPRPGLPRPEVEPMLPDAPMVDPGAAKAAADDLAGQAAPQNKPTDDSEGEAEDDMPGAAEPQVLPPATVSRAAGLRVKGAGRADRRTAPRRGRHAEALEPVSPQDADSVDIADTDDLLEITGIDPVIGAGLERLGLTRFAQIAGLSAEGKARIEAALGLEVGRIDRQLWAEQAAALAAVETQDKSRK